MKNVLFICHTFLHCLISIEKCMLNKWKADFIICDSIYEYKEIVSKIQGAEFLNGGEAICLEEWKIGGQHHNRFERIFKRNIEKELRQDLKGYDDIYIYNDMFCIGKYLQIQKINYHLIEDSVNYFAKCDIREMQKRAPRKRLFKYRQESLYFADSAPPYVLDLEVNDKSHIPGWIKIPVIERNRRQLLDGLSTTQKRWLITAFMDPSSIQSLENIDQKKKVLLLTQPFYEDKKYQIKKVYDLYMRVIDIFIQKGYVVVVKPHPRDILKYSDLKNVVYLASKFPIELIDFLSTIKFDAAITINSSSIYLLNNIELKIILGKEILDLDALPSISEWIDRRLNLNV